MKFYYFFFNDTATTEIYTLSLHDALPILKNSSRGSADAASCRQPGRLSLRKPILTGLVRAEGLEPPQLSSLEPKSRDRKSTRLNSSHANISYAVFCLKKKTTHCDV